jgi:prolipoprotein diacylglyceryltransferase
MIPYFAQPVWAIGPLNIHAFGIAEAAALVGGYALVLSRAKRSGLDDRRTGWLFIVMVLAGLLAGAWRQAGESATGVIAGALAVAIVAWLGLGAPILPHIDLLASTAPVIGALARFGCFLAHDHRGMPSVRSGAGRGGTNLVVMEISRDTGSGDPGCGGCRNRSPHRCELSALAKPTVGLHSKRDKTAGILTFNGIVSG